MIKEIKEILFFNFDEIRKHEKSSEEFIYFMVGHNIRLKRYNSRKKKGKKSWDKFIESENKLLNI